MIRRNLLFVFLLLSPVLLMAGVLDEQSGGRPRGMGGAFTGIADDISAVEYNPSGLGQFMKGEIQFLYDNHYSLDLLNSFSFSIASPGIGEGTLGFSYKNTGVGSAVNFLNNYSENIYDLSYGVELLPLFYIGANIKYVRINFDINASAISYDAGVLFRAFDKHLSAGVMIRNINKPSLRWENNTTEQLPSVFRIGLGFRPNNDMLFGLDIDKLNEENYNIHAGAEMWLFSRMFCPRAGLALLQGDGMTLNAGFSFLYKAFRLDYTLESHYELGVNHIFGVLVKF